LNMAKAEQLSRFIEERHLLAKLERLEIPPIAEPPRRHTAPRSELRCEFQQA
jgi:hypothetical protein